LAPEKLNNAVSSNFLIATKSDDAEVLVSIWNKRLWAGVGSSESARHVFSARYPGHCPLDAIRRVLLSLW
jgi:hypothetical protein